MDEQQAQKSTQNSQVSISNSVAKSTVENKVSAVSSVPKTEVEEEQTHQNIRVNKPLKTQRRAAFSLNMDLDKKAEIVDEQLVVEENKPKDNFDEQKIKIFWQDFLQQLKMEKRIPAYNVFETVKIKKVDDFLITFELGSASSEVEFETFRDRIVNGLKTFLNNYSIRVETLVSESIASVNHIKSKKQIATEMGEKNPAFVKLLNDFGLNLFD